MLALVWPIRRPRSAIRLGARTPAAFRRLTGRTCFWSRSTAWRVVPLPPPVRRSAATGARTSRRWSCAAGRRPGAVTTDSSRTDGIRGAAQTPDGRRPAGRASHGIHLGDASSSTWVDQLVLAEASCNSRSSPSPGPSVATGRAPGARDPAAARARGSRSREGPERWSPYLEAAVETGRAAMIPGGDVARGGSWAAGGDGGWAGADVLAVGAAETVASALLRRRSRPGAPDRTGSGRARRRGQPAVRLCRRARGAALIDAEQRRLESAEAWAREALGTPDGDFRTPRGCGSGARRWRSRAPRLATDEAERAALRGDSCDAPSRPSLMPRVRSRSRRERGAARSGCRAARPRTSAGGRGRRATAAKGSAG